MTKFERFSEALETVVGFALMGFVLFSAIGMALVVGLGG